MNVWMLIGAALAGGAGAGLRYLVDVLVIAGRPRRLPLGILVVNVTGSFALGLVTGLAETVLDGGLAWVLGVGLLGGYTTFSTMSLDSALLLRGGAARRAWLNAGGTLVLCVAAAASGLGVGRLL